MIEVRTKIRKKGGGSGSSGGFGASVLSQIADIQASAFTQLTGLRTLLVPVDESGAELSYAEAEKAVALKSKLDFFSERNVSALGMTGEPGEGGGGGLDVEELAQYLAEKGYATQEWVNSRGFLTSHQSLADYLTRSEAAGLYQPKGSYVAYGRQSLATANGTNLMPQFINIENENLIAGYKNYWNVINLGSYSGGNFRSQIAMPYQEDITDTDIFIRTANGTRWRTWRRLLHDGNFASVLDSAYVKKAGDTMLGSLYFTNANSQIYGNDNDGLILRYGSHFLRLASGGLTHNGQYQIWDSGNDGAGSGLDADLLDGHHASDFNPLRYVGTNTDAHNAYVVLCQAYNDEGGNGINGGMFNGTVYIERGGFWATVKKTAVMIQCGGQYLNNVANYQILSDFSGGVTGLYKIIYNGKAYIALGSSLWNGSRFYATGMWTEQPFVINDDDAGITSSTLLNGTPQIESNAISATNADKLDGYHADGFIKLRNRSYISDTTAIANMNATASSGNTYLDHYGILLQNDNNAMSFYVGGMQNERKALIQVGHAQPSLANYTGILLLNPFGGNVGIGTPTPTANLHVNGTGLFSGELSLGSHLQVYNTIYFKQTGAYLENTDPDRLSLNWRVNEVWQTTPFMFNKSGDFTATGNIVASGNIACWGAVTEASELEDIYQRLARLENEVF